MSNSVAVKPELLVWARNRASLEPMVLRDRFPKLADWEAGQGQPTLKQLEHFAHVVHIPMGYLFLAQPIEETLPVPDFRTVASIGVSRPSPNLLDTMYLCQQRQEWYRDYARVHGLGRLDFVGSASVGDDAVRVAEAMRSRLGLSSQEREQVPSWSEALRQLTVRAEEIGVLVMASSIVGSNSHRKLEVTEFRGFALADDLAPLVFLNAADTKAAQMFTAAHELAHLWLGQSGIFDTEAGRIPEQSVEQWCNAVAAELLVPLETIRDSHVPGSVLAEEIQRLARVFKVSTLVILRRLADAGVLDSAALWQAYSAELERLRGIEKGGTGGDFYRTLGARTGKRFARAVLTSTLEGQTLFQDAFRMLGIRKSETFYQAARELEVLP